MKFSELPRPFIICVLSDGDVNQCIRTAKLGELDGADGFQLELQNFTDFPPSKQQMKDVIGSTIKPVWTTNRRRRVSQEHGEGKRQSEEDRIKLELDALEAGAVCIDMEMDTFDWWAEWDDARRQREWARLKNIPVDKNDFPRECCFNHEAITKQQKVIDDVHAVGAEMLLSCHVLVRVSTEGIVQIAKELERRGADLIKIVVWNDTFYDLCDTLRANVLLKDTLKSPFKLMSQGEPSKLGRYLFALFGSAWAFCQQDLRPGGFHYRPLVSTEKFIMQHLDWKPNWTLHNLLKERIV